MQVIISTNENEIILSGRFRDVRTGFKALQEICTYRGVNKQIIYLSNLLIVRILDYFITDCFLMRNV